MFAKITSMFVTALALSFLTTSDATAQSQSIPIRYSATQVVAIPVMPFSVTKVETAQDLGSDLFRVWIPGYLAVTTAPNQYFNWAAPAKFQSSGTVTVQGTTTPMQLILPGHLIGIAPLPGNVAIGTHFRFDVETRDATGQQFTGHKISVDFLRQS